MSASKKLLFILHDRPNYPSGPIVNYLRLLPALVDKGYVVHVLAIYKKDYPNARKLVQYGVSVWAKSSPYTEPLIKWILQKVEAIQPDVFIPDVSAPGCFAGKWLIAANIPVINTHRSDDTLNWGKALYFSDRKYGQTLTGIVCVSRYLQENLLNRIGETSILSTVIPSGVESSMFRADQNGAGLKIVYAGRLIEKQKRISLLLDSFIRLCQRYADVSFTLIGDGPERANCTERITKSGFQSRFLLPGKLSGDDYKRTLAQSQVLILLSDYEGTPGSVMDGMSCGLVPICLHYNGVEELVRPSVNGLLVHNREDELDAAVDMLYHDVALRKRLSAAAVTTIEEEFSLNNAVGKWGQFFGQCQQTIGEKGEFKSPRKIVLPPYDSILVEDKRIAMVPLLTRIKNFIPLNRIFRLLFK
jgi:glycosyltransferase involved in cell wall biosynthesis